MSEQIAYDEWLSIDGYDISGVSSNFGFEVTNDLKDVLCFPAPTITSATVPYRKRLPGPVSGKNSIAGYLDTDVNLPAFEAAFGGSPIVSYGSGRALGSRVWMYVGKQGTMQHGGAVGEVIPITAEIMSDGAVVPGDLFEFSAKTATLNGTTRTISAVTTGKARYINTHVVAVSGTTPSMTVVFETSVIGDYTDAITRWTSSAFTTTGVQRAAITTAVGDLNGRFRWTISGTNPSFLVRFSHGVK